jgi:hypothetical protein
MSLEQLHRIVAQRGGADADDARTTMRFCVTKYYLGIQQQL